MSGLAGFTGTDCKNLLAKYANQVQQHRGREFQSIWQDDQYAFAHQYFSLDGAAHLPNYIIRQEDHVILFAGELYNVETLIQLTGKQYDAEIASYPASLVLDLYLQFSFNSFSLLQGMFSIAIYSVKTGELILVRDQFGIKPLFYYQQDSIFGFSSELKALIPIPGFNKKLNAKALVSSLNYVWISGEDTMFEAVRKLAPAHYLIRKVDGQIKLHRYWDFSFDGSKLNTLSENELSQKVRSLLEASIIRQLPRDHRVGAFLSGGLDSSLITVVAKKHKQDLSTFTIATSGTDKRVEQMADDEYYASYLAREFRIDHHKIKISPDIVNDLPSIVRLLDEPIGDPAAINTYLICKAARDRGIRILLSGMGSDELFVGHRAAWASLLSQQLNRLPSPLINLTRLVVNRLPVMIGNRGFRFGRWSKRFMSFMEMPVDLAYMRSYSYYSPDELKALVTEAFRPGVDSLLQEHNYYFYKRKELDLKNRISYTDLHLFMVGLNLTYTDRASMGASVIVRTPFIDKEFADTIMSLHGDWKLKNRIGKYILKLASRNLLPDKIINRPKSAFGAPIRAWISKDLKAMVDEYLSEDSINRRGLVNYSFVKKMIETDRSGQNDYAYQLYQLLTLECWCREYLDKNPLLPVD